MMFLELCWVKYVKARIGRDYRYSAKPVLRALWDNYNECQYVDDTGEFILAFDMISDLTLH